VSKRPAEEIATPEELVAAISGLSVEAQLRLYRLGDLLAFGSEFADGKELLGEAVKRALIGTSGTQQRGERGRPWPRDVDIAEFLAGCMKSIANGSRNSRAQQVTQTAEAVVEEDGEANAKLADLNVHTPGVDEELVGREEARARAEAAEADVALIEAHFANDQDVLAILEGEKDGMTAAELRDTLELTPTAYNSARRRLRRHLDQLMPGRMRK
jgi:hypothetical protein